jgi:ketosteroid isomerase-like protein
MTAADRIVALERAALDRWGSGDPAGFLDLYADGISYFDPLTPLRIDGHRAMREYYRPFTGQIQVPRYEMINPEVVVDGNMALLTYNLVNYAGDGAVMNRWNSTTVFRKIEGEWKSIHSHWSFANHPALQTSSPA